MSAKEKLRTFLFEEGRELINIKFFPGTRKDLTAEEMLEAAHAVLVEALTAPDQSAPHTGKVRA